MLYIVVGKIRKAPLNTWDKLVRMAIKEEEATGGDTIFRDK